MRCTCSRSTPRRRHLYALGHDGRVLGELQIATDTQRGSRARRHAELLAPGIRSLCEQTGVELSQLAAIAVDEGPGLFTGLRVGVTTAKVMAQVLAIPIVAVPSLDLVAYPVRYTSRQIVAVLDARRARCSRRRTGRCPVGSQRVSDYRVLSPADLVAELASSGDELLLAGDGIEGHRDLFAELEHAERAGPCSRRRARSHCSSWRRRASIRRSSSPRARCSLGICVRATPRSAGIVCDGGASRGNRARRCMCSR